MRSGPPSVGLLRARRLTRGYAAPTCARRTTGSAADLARDADPRPTQPRGAIPAPRPSLARAARIRKTERRLVHA
jgi:hypothetical protein